jgi:hypothetical protein
MPFQPGHDKNRNTKGRPRRPKPLYDREIKDMLREFLHNNLPGMQAVYDKISANEKARMIISVTKLVEPPPMHPIEQLTDDQFAELINRIRNGE